MFMIKIPAKKVKTIGYYPLPPPPHPALKKPNAFCLSISILTTTTTKIQSRQERRKILCIPKLAHVIFNSICVYFSLC